MILFKQEVTCSKLDAQFITCKVGRLPLEMIKPTLNLYSNVYKHVFENEPVEHKKENAARKEANSRLVSYIDKIQSKTTR